jgi:hypothetical protein
MNREVSRVSVTSEFLHDDCNVNRDNKILMDAETARLQAYARDKVDPFLKPIIVKLFAETPADPIEVTLVSMSPQD